MGDRKIFVPGRTQYAVKYIYIITVRRAVRFHTDTFTVTVFSSLGTFANKRPLKSTLNHSFILVKSVRKVCAN